MNVRNEGTKGASLCGSRTLWQRRRTLLYLEVTNGSKPRYGVMIGGHSSRFMKRPG